VKFGSADNRRLWADTFAYRVSLWVSNNWLKTAVWLLVGAIIGSVLAGPVAQAGWSGVSTFATCYALVLAIGIFTWTLAGFSAREADKQKRASDAFATNIGARPYGHGSLSDWHREKLAVVLRVPEESVEDEVLVQLIEQSNSQGPRDALVITNRLWFLRLVGRGRGGKQVLDLATGERLA
jgi:hypothetical protein